MLLVSIPTAGIDTVLIEYFFANELLMTISKLFLSRLCAFNLCCKLAGALSYVC